MWLLVFSASVFETSAFLACLKALQNSGSIPVFISGMIQHVPVVLYCTR